MNHKRIDLELIRSIESITADKLCLRSEVKKNDILLYNRVLCQRVPSRVLSSKLYRLKYLSDKAFGAAKRRCQIELSEEIDPEVLTNSLEKMSLEDSDEDSFPKKQAANFSSPLRQKREGNTQNTSPFSSPLRQKRNVSFNTSRSASFSSPNAKSSGASVPNQSSGTPTFTVSNLLLTNPFDIQPGSGDKNDPFIHLADLDIKTAGNPHFMIFTGQIEENEKLYNALIIHRSVHPNDADQWSAWLPDPDELPPHLQDFASYSIMVQGPRFDYTLSKLLADKIHKADVKKLHQGAVHKARDKDAYWLIILPDARYTPKNTFSQTSKIHSMQTHTTLRKDREANKHKKDMRSSTITWYIALDDGHFIGTAVDEQLDGFSDDEGDKTKEEDKK